MGLRPREWLTHYHLMWLTGLVSISLALVIVGGSLSAWCIRYGETFECHSLFYSDRAFSCLFKLVPAGVIICLILSLIMFIILTIGHVYFEYGGIAKREYQLVARLVNILVLSIAIILIMFVLLQWFHPPVNSSRKIIIAKIPALEDANNVSQNKLERISFETISPDHPSYLKAIGAQRRSMLIYDQNIHHGPNLFFAAFIILFLTLLIFVIAHEI